MKRLKQSILILVTGVLSLVIFTLVLVSHKLENKAANSLWLRGDNDAVSFSGSGSGFLSGSGSGMLPNETGKFEFGYSIHLWIIIVMNSVIIIIRIY